MTSSGKVKIQVWLLILAVFLLGSVTGASVDRLVFMKGKGEPPANGGGRRGPGRMVEQMKKDLNLTDEQATSVRKIFEESRKEFPAWKFNECPGVTESREKSRTQIRAVLTPEQQKKYDDFNSQRDAEMRKDAK
jgi:Spy/CpxP family protein refolding chaperone